VAKKIGIHVVGISGTDLIDGNKKLILAIVWQLMRKDSQSVIIIKFYSNLKLTMIAIYNI
jgi:hypothetical protein